MAQPQPKPQPQASPSLTIRNTDLTDALHTLRTTSSIEALSALRIVITEANLWHWHGSPWPGACAAFDDDDMDGYTRLFPTPLPPSPPPREAFRELLRLVARRCNLAALDLEVDLSEAAWGLFGGSGAAAYCDAVDQEWRFVYEFYMDVGRVLAEVFGERGELRGLEVKTVIWDGVGAWLVGQIRGREAAVAGGLPEYHNAATRLLPGKEDEGDGMKTD